MYRYRNERYGPALNTEYWAHIYMQNDTYHVHATGECIHLCECWILNFDIENCIFCRAPNVLYIGLELLSVVGDSVLTGSKFKITKFLFFIVLFNWTFDVAISRALSSKLFFLRIWSDWFWISNTNISFLNDHYNLLSG